MLGTGLNYGTHFSVVQEQNQVLMGHADIRHRELFLCSVSEFSLGDSVFFFLDIFSQLSYRT